MTDHTARQWVAKQIARLRTLRRALYGGHEDDRMRVVHGIVRRLPIPIQTKQKVLDWCMVWILDRQKSAARLMQKAQADWNARGQRRLNRLLSSNEVLEVPPTKSPVMTFILVTKEKAHLTVLSLESVVKFADVPYELIVVDNASADSTLAMLEKFKGAKIIRNLTNVGFGPACMQAADIATGQYLCFLNNDALLAQDVVPAVLKNFEHNRLAPSERRSCWRMERCKRGSIIWSDGSALGYGRGADPDLPQYNFRRPVDFAPASFW